MGKELDAAETGRGEHKGKLAHRSARGEEGPWRADCDAALLQDEGASGG